MNAARHMDCRNFVAIDVAKGVCHRTKDVVLADGESCEHFLAIPKCRLCGHFAPTGEHLGACHAVAHRPMAYPDLIAVTCEMFCEAPAKA